MLCVNATLSLMEQEDWPEVARKVYCVTKMWTCVINTITLCPQYPEQHRCFCLSTLEIHVNCSSLVDTDVWVCAPRFHVSTVCPAAEGLWLFLQVFSSCRTRSLQDTLRALHGLSVPHWMSGREVCREWVWRHGDSSPHGPSPHHWDLKMDCVF